MSATKLSSSIALSLFACAAYAQNAQQEVPDGLTSLCNRRYLDASLPRALVQTEREDKPLVVIMLDLDHFKKINDQYEHTAGDTVLLELAELLKKGARDSDFIHCYLLYQSKAAGRNRISIYIPQ